MPNDWKEAHDKAKEYIADLEKANVKLRDSAIKYLERAENAESFLSDAMALLLRITQWDMMDAAADGKYWRNEIAKFGESMKGKL